MTSKYWVFFSRCSSDWFDSRVRDAKISTSCQLHEAPLTYFKNVGGNFFWVPKPGCLIIFDPKVPRIWIQKAVLNCNQIQWAAGRILTFQVYHSASSVPKIPIDIYSLYYSLYVYFLFPPMAVSTSYIYMWLSHSNFGPPIDIHASTSWIAMWIHGECF